MGDVHIVGGIKTLYQNYSTWVMCNESHLKGQNLWEIVGGSKAMELTIEDNNGVLWKWKVKAGKVMFALKTTIKEEMLEHIWDAKTRRKLGTCCIN